MIAVGDQGKALSLPDHGDFYASVWRPCSCSHDVRLDTIWMNYWHVGTEQGGCEHANNSGTW